MKDKDEIVELFSEKLRDMEAEVNPQLWSNISSQLGAKTAAASAVKGSISLTAKIIGAVVGVAAITTTVILLMKNSSVDEKKSISTNEVTDSLTKEVIINDTDYEGSMEPDRIELSNEYEAGREENDQENNRIELPEELPVVTELTIEHTDDYLNKDRLVQEDTPEPETAIEESEKKNEQPVIDNQLVENEAEEIDIKEPEVKELAPEESRVNIEIPNVFTPNGDRDNDLLFIKTDGELNDFAVVVFDSNGNVIYRNADPNFKWNGADMSGGTAPDGVYLLMITAKDSAGKEVLKTAYVNLLR